MNSSRRDILGAGTATILMGGRPAWAQAPSPARPLRVTGLRQTIFYAPLVASVTLSFLRAEGVESTFHWLGSTPFLDGLREGSIDVIQSSVSQYWALADRGETNIPVHIAEINQRDGFFLLRRGTGPAFEWKNLEGRAIAVELGGQPAYMLQYALNYNKVDVTKVRLMDGGTGAALVAAYKNGSADFGHFQGAAAQQLELEGAGTIVASVGASMPAVAFSSICCLRTFVQTPTYRPFLKAFANAKIWAHRTPAQEVAEHMAPHFPDESRPAMVAAIKAYQALGCWAGSLGTSREHYNQALRVLSAAGAIKRQYEFEDVCIIPPV